MSKKKVREIPGQPGYFLDKDGNVYSKWINKGIHGLVLGDELKVLKGSKQRSGHISIRFGRNGRRAFVHRLMFETFIGEIPKGKVIRHLNDVPYDNRLKNLDIGTQSDNMRDCVENGNHFNPNRRKTYE